MNQQITNIFFVPKIDAKNDESILLEWKQDLINLYFFKRSKGQKFYSPDTDRRGLKKILRFI